MSAFRWDYVTRWFGWREGFASVPWPVSAILDMLGCEVERDLDWDWPA